MKLNVLLQANVPHGARLCDGAGAASALLRAPGHRAGRGEQVHDDDDDEDDDDDDGDDNDDDDCQVRMMMMVMMMMMVNPPRA